MYKMKKTGRKIISVSPNTGIGAICNPEMPDCKLCVVEEPSSKRGFVQLWVRSSNILKDQF